MELDTPATPDDPQQVSPADAQQLEASDTSVSPANALDKDAQPPLASLKHVLEQDQAAPEASNVSTEQPRAATETLSFVWPVKSIQFPPGSSESVFIVLQNDNGPCSLIALANLLLLSRRIVLRPNTRSVSFEELAERIANELLARVTNAEADRVAGALEVLPKTRFGLDVNVRFASVDGFADDGTGALALFELAGAKLLHGWVADEADHDTWEAVVTRAGDYDTAVARLVEADELASNLVVPSDGPAAPLAPEEWSPEQRLLVSDALLIRRFLDSTASQLTYSGLFSLATSALSPGHLAALFRNAHFTVIYRRPSKAGEPTLFHLVTDATLARARSVVWEGLTDVDGSAAAFYDAHLTPAAVDGDFVSPPSPSIARRGPQKLSEADMAAITKRDDADEMLAAQMQQQEYDAEEERRRRRAAEQERRRASAPPPQPKAVPAAQTDAVKRKKAKEKDKNCVVS